MNLPKIDWNAVWRKHQAEKKMARRDPDIWNKRASHFTRRAKASGYIGQFMTILNPQPDWSVLDIGSGAGTLAVPLSGAVRRITALDPAVEMLALLEERCRKHGITNIERVKGRWEDDWDQLEIGVHDVAIASRSLLVEDLREAILKLRSHAAKRVFISAMVDDGPRDRRIVEAAGRSFHHGADYIVVYNLLRQMGIYANVTFICNEEEKTYDSVDHALQSLRWMVHDMMPQEEAKLRTYLSRNLVSEGDRWRLPGRRTIRWAVIWWDQE